MYKINSQIKIPTLFTIQSISDDRGLLIPFTDNIDHSLFHRCYIVENYGKEVIRGLHYHKKEIKIFTIVSGAAKFITLELPVDIADRNQDNEIKDYVVAHCQNLYPKYVINQDLECFNSKELYVIWLSLLHGKIDDKTSDRMKIVFDRCMQYVRDVINEKKKE